MEAGSPLLVLDAAVELASPAGRRTLPLADFLLGPAKTALADDELVAAVHVPAPPPRSGSAYLRLEYRRAMEIAVVGAAALVVLDDGAVAEARVALTAVAPTCVRAPAAEDALRGREPAEAVLAEAAAASASHATPIDDVRAPADYRRAMVPVIVPARPRASRRAREGRRSEIPAEADRERDPVRRPHRPDRSLLSVLRNELGLTGTKEGCDDSECGACMVLLDGRPLNSCSYLAVQAPGASSRRSRGSRTADELAPAPAGVPRRGRRPVRLLHARDAHLGHGAPPREPARATRRSVRRSAGNLCRCTGYQGIVRAVKAAAAVST